jgi:hypothetical protein
MESGMNISKISHSNVLKLSWGTFTTIVALAIAAPSFAQSAVSLGRNFRPDPAALDGSGGGSISIASIAGISNNCRGFANAEPNHTITLTETFPVMDLLVYSSNINDVNDDPTMLIKGPNGFIVCADNESSGRNPQFTGRMPKGSYQVWVGSKNVNQAFSYKLSLSEILQK